MFYNTPRRNNPREKLLREKMFLKMEGVGLELNLTSDFNYFRFVTEN